MIFDFGCMDIAPCVGGWLTLYDGPPVGAQDLSHDASLDTMTGRPADVLTRNVFAAARDDMPTTDIKAVTTAMALFANGAGNIELS